MKNSQNIWDKHAGRYDRFLRKDAATNAPHIMQEPENALLEIRRALKDGGVLAALAFTHVDNLFLGKVKFS